MTIFGAEIPFAAHCGIEEVGLEDGVTRVRVETRPQHGNNVGIVHGGLICTLLDVALGTAARTTIGRPVVTIDMQVAFLAAGRGTMTAAGRVVRAGRSIVFCEAEVTAADGEVVARATGVFKPVRSSPAAPSPAAVLS